jgi:hypothetical protein
MDMSYPLSAATHPTTAAAPARTRLWTGRTLTTVAVLFLVVDAIVKLLRLPVAVDSTVQMGYPAALVVPLGVLEAALLVVYLIPRAAPVGAILWTAYLGGAVATHLRIGDPMFTHVLFPTYVAAMLWGGLWLRDTRVRGLLK